ncbi:Uncharacterised protein [Legionella feeleii]|uniref:Uncharacterized protein n=1 Tax=Legionella feeleii TaxID=453 RepID=A0A2X1QS20_9GAMM|nr:Uncharacterised protein [Legionella feeleii]
MPYKPIKCLKNALRNRSVKDYLGSGFIVTVVAESKHRTDEQGDFPGCSESHPGYFYR